MDVLIIGHSGTIGRQLPPAERMAAQLHELLREDFPDRDVKIWVEPWRLLTESRLEELMMSVRDRKPDYVIVEPVSFWVSMPVLKYMMAWRSPGFAAPLARRFRRFRAQWYTWMHRHAPAAVFCLQNDFVGFVERRLLGAKPLLTVAEAMHMLDRLVWSAQRLESTEVVLLVEAPQTQSERLAGRSRKSQSTIRRHRPRGSDHLIAEFVAGLHALCERRHATCMETVGAREGDRGLDGHHSGPEKARQKAMQLRHAILAFERAVTSVTLAMDR
jgi:hypothetical protein